MLRQFLSESSIRGTIITAGCAVICISHSSGSLPTSWGTPGAFSKLANFSVFWNRLSGSIPASWSTISSLRQFWVQPGNLQLCGGWPGTNLTVLCKNLGAGCIRLANLSNTCSFSPGTSALYLPPSPSLNYLQVKKANHHLYVRSAEHGGKSSNIHDLFLWPRCRSRSSYLVISSKIM